MTGHIKGKIRNYFGACYFCGKYKEAHDREMCLECFLEGKAIFTERFSGAPDRRKKEKKCPKCKQTIK